MRNLNYLDLLDRAGRNAGERAALIDGTGTLSHRELISLTNRLANCLLDQDFAPETPFAVLSPNTNLALATIIGGMRAGGAWSNVNLRSGVHVNTDVLNRGGCRALFFDSSIQDQIPAMREGAPSIEVVVCLDRQIGDIPSLEQFIANASDRPVNIHLPSDGTGFQGSTGGTTGAPKITQAGQDFLSWDTLGFMTALTDFDLDHPPVNLSVAPITHAGGIIAMAALALGGTVVMMSVADPEQILDNIPRHKVSLLFLPPTVIYILMNHPKCRETDFSSLRYLISAAAPFAVEKIARAHEIFGPVVCQSYGQTESGFPLTFLSPAAVTAALKDEKLAPRLKSVGLPTAAISCIEIMNDDGDLLGPDEVGEIVIKGPTVMFRYINDPEATAAIHKDGWQHTGDLGYRDADGYLYISDRKRDLIISGGFNVFPLEVEQVLAQHPAVQDCAVIGVPDEKWGEAVKAVIERAPGTSVTAEELIALCKEKLGGVMAPKSVDFIDQLPRSAVGKVLKRDLRAQYWENRETRI
ncbi:AMP-binding protein [uncultured Sneathiella sp.]|uniref:class I adenylate-forming enzyme family protein n=1 Tax=uncultured Sneathiella sp. TaxID=879315 RepID=UPI0030EC705D|tara:strand:- start:770 stop:2344 length:1575 start_codon:yes stop_codon:yes gene_type:complete